MTIGITGRYCAGKSIASSVFEENGFTVINVDGVGHEALEVKKVEITRVFGNEILSAGRVDRKKLGGKVFKSPAEKEKLESIVHPWMVGRVKTMARKQKDTVINAALLIEMGLYRMCDFVMAVDIGDATALERGMSRDCLSKEEAARRIRAQIPLKEKLDFVDKVIDNNGDIKDFKKRVEQIIKTIRSKV
ncbi:MAG TPA: dephospho-CoA kinase [Spirochaetes bacterium]|nr:dephospho-CoA kinase [Spirochaetota bacterium]